ncbi:MAG TPA: aminotransferase class V-fold PLP-dependent enzyme [Candidatus Coproplasma excrementigallinarum]|uniref:cysteine desulfurase n=1 Tax=Candidatus Coproplasma excrementigallinarum TaxID=2840747 RepID=A0A9D1MK38_9FIRM|nr:aminotransferase class V-fold PLP-dependent enzyme [Candidatus Coproplasma excrementigallinarum]
MIYFDNAATGGIKPQSVLSAVSASLKMCANPGRSGHKLSIACMERVYACRRMLMEFFGGYSCDRTIFTKNCTEALNIALLGTLRAGDKVVTTFAEHNSVLRPLQYLEDRGVEITLAPLGKNGEIDATKVASYVHADTKAVIITLASNVTGASPDIKKLRALIPPCTLLLCDGAQACGHEAINMRECGIDALAVAGHKGMYGIQGSGALLFSERIDPAPILFGGTGSESFNLNMPAFYPDRLESGTVNYPAIVSLAEGVLYLKSHFNEERDKLFHLTKLLIAEMEQMPFIRLYSRPNYFGIVAFAIDGTESERAAYRLSEEFSVCVRGGLHCAPLMHEALGTSEGGLVRASLSPFNTEKEVELFLTALKFFAVK